MRKRYTAQERSAYSLGRAYAKGKAGKRVQIRSASGKRSFSAGVKSVKKR